MVLSYINSDVIESLVYSTVIFIFFLSGMRKYFYIILEFVSFVEFAIFPGFIRRVFGDTMLSGYYC